MRQQDIKTLMLLEELAKDGATSQRALAKRLGISLGLVNSFVKRLARKGYFKISTIPRNRVRYALTPRGMAEKYRLSMDYLRYSLGYYGEIKELVERCLAELTRRGVRRVAVWGSGEIAELVCLFLKAHDLKLVGVVDPQPEGKLVLGHKVRPPGDLPSLRAEAVVLAELTPPEKAMASMKGLGVPRSAIVPIAPPVSQEEGGHA